MKIIGVTGTNGKTSFTYILKHILESVGYRCYVSGTLSNRLTTPSPWDLRKTIQEYTRKKFDYFIMEVSSHGIHQDRIRGIFFFAKILTNITRDHLDYHHSMQAYKKVKMGWMLNPFSISIFPKDWKKTSLHGFKVPLLGHFNFENIQAAVTMAQSLGIHERNIIHAVAELKPIPGRFEQIHALGPVPPRLQNVHVIVDYAHTPDGLKNVLTTCKKILKSSHGRLITVFGCGGDRDRTKRPLMGQEVRKASDLAYLTNDNPRTENPEQIFEDVQLGVPGWKALQVMPDRKKAIYTAIDQAEGKDIVLIAGKGHENYQIIGKRRIPFSDKKIILGYFKEQESHAALFN